MTNSNILQIRKIIFENFNEIDLRFNNDEIYELLKKNDNFDQSQTIDDLANDFKKIEDDGLVRCIAQNFTTQWFKIFDDVEKINCPSLIFSIQNCKMILINISNMMSTIMNSSNEIWDLS